MYNSVGVNQHNMNGECANFGCDFARRKMFPKATYYDTQVKSWVCQCCAQAINREGLARARKYNVPFTPRCISSEEALFQTLKTGSLTV